MISQRSIVTTISKQGDGALHMKLVHKPTETTVEATGSYEGCKRSCLDQLAHRLGEEIEEGFI